MVWPYDPAVEAERVNSKLVPVRGMSAMSRSNYDLVFLEIRRMP